MLFQDGQMSKTIHREKPKLKICTVRHSNQEKTHTKQYYMLLWMHIYVGKNFKTGMRIQTPEPGLWFPWGRETWGPPALCKAKMAQWQHLSKPSGGVT